VIGPDETSVAPSFLFTFMQGGMASAARATGVGIVYEGSCTQTTPTACFSNAGSPIIGNTAATGTANDSATVTETTATTVQQGGVATCAFGTYNPFAFVGFTIAPTTPTLLAFVDGDEGTNAGLDLYNRQETTAITTDGPWQATLPSSNTGDNIAQCIGIIPIGF